MRFKTVGNKFDVAAVVVRSAESSSTISRGTPVALVMNATNDGLAVVLPATAAAVKATSLAFGVALADIVAGAYGESQVFGFCSRVKYATTRTRANSTDAYASVAAASVGMNMNVDTVNNALAVSATQGASAFLPFAVLCETIASLASVASTTSDTSVASYATGYCKVFLRMM